MNILLETYYRNDRLFLTSNMDKHFDEKKIDESQNLAGNTTLGTFMSKFHVNFEIELPLICQVSGSILELCQNVPIDYVIFYHLIPSSRLPGCTKGHSRQLNSFSNSNSLVYHNLFLGRQLIYLLHLELNFP